MKLVLSANILTPEVKRVPNMLALTGEIERDISFLSSVGYKGIEFITTNPREINVKHLETLMDKYSMIPVGVNTGRITGELGLTLTSPNEDIRHECEKRAIDCLDFASIWHIPVNIGILRGTIKDSNTDKRNFEVRLIKSLEKLTNHAEKVDVSLAIETVAPPLMDYINTLDEAKELIDKIKSPKLGVMYDFFQMDLTETDVNFSVKKHIKRCKHLHFSDSKRKIPGEGNINFDSIVKSLSETCYNGSASIEIASIPNERDAANRAAKYLLPLFKKYE